MAEKERIEKVMQSVGMNSAIFANAIGIQGSTLSHILNGRNNPSLTVLQSILKRFPHINPEWLILGQGAMERATKQSQGLNLFDLPEVMPVQSAPLTSEKPEISIPSPEPIRQKVINSAQNVVTPSQPEVANQQISVSAAAQQPRSVVKVIIYYSDNTFQELK